MMKLRRNLFTTVSTLAVASAVILTGCAAPASADRGKGQATALAETGILTLSVNPSIEIEYNKEGKVVDLTGKNDDGKAVVASYQDYIGKDCDDVLEDLVEEIYEAGYFVNDVDVAKKTKNIVIQLEPGSVLPEKDFLERMGERAEEAVEELTLTSGIITIDDDDYDQKYARDGKPSHYITREKAQEIVLNQAGVDAKKAVFEEREFDFDDGEAVFELEFAEGGNVYEYKVDAITGKILEAEDDRDDVDDDRDDADDDRDDADDDWDDADDDRDDADDDRDDADDDRNDADDDRDDADDDQDDADDDRDDADDDRDDTDDDRDDADDDRDDADDDRDDADDDRDDTDDDDQDDADDADDDRDDVDDDQNDADDADDDQDNANDDRDDADDDRDDADDDRDDVDDDHDDTADDRDDDADDQDDVDDDQDDADDDQDDADDDQDDVDDDQDDTDDDQDDAADDQDDHDDTDDDNDNDSDDDD